MGYARRKYTDAYKAEAVDLVVTSGRPIAEIARDLGINEGTLGNWVNLAKKRGELTEKPLTVDERAELAELRDENRRLKMEREILKKRRRGLRRKACEVRVHSRSRCAAGQQTTPREDPGELMCQVLQVSRPGYYAWLQRQPSRREREDGELTERIVQLHREHAGRLGVQRLVAELAKQGHHHSPKRVRRLARAAGLSCVHPRPYRATTVGDQANPDGLVDLVERQFVPAAADELWFTDVTYIKTWTGWAYLAAVIDGCTRKVVGWALDTHMRTSLVTDALAMAITRQRPAIGQCVVHSDRGAQYTSKQFRELALSNGIIPSVGDTGICYDNAMAESFNAKFKKELIYLHTWPTLEKLRKEVFTYIEIYYNRKRPHSGLAHLTPCEMEQCLLQELDVQSSKAS